MTGIEIGADAILGILLPLAVSLLKSVAWPRQAKVALAAGLSLALAVIVSLVAGNLDLSTLANWTAIFMVASTTYTTILEKTSIEAKLRGTLVK